MVDKREAVMIDQSKNACKRLRVDRKTADGKKPHSGDVKQTSLFYPGLNLRKWLQSNIKDIVFHRILGFQALRLTWR